MIARRLAYRIWLACLRDQSDRLRKLSSIETAEDSYDLHGGDRAARRSGAKSPGRQEQAALYAARAARLREWVAGNGPKGDPIDPSVVALVSAYLYRDTVAEKSLREWAALRGAYSGPPASEVIEFIRWIVEVTNAR